MTDVICCEISKKIVELILCNQERKKLKHGEREQRLSLDLDRMRFEWIDMPNLLDSIKKDIVKRKDFKAALNLCSLYDDFVDCYCDILFTFELRGKGDFIECVREWMGYMNFWLSVEYFEVPLLEGVKYHVNKEGMLCDGAGNEYRRINDVEAAKKDNTKPVLPNELNTDKAKGLLARAVEAELCTDGYKWAETKALLAYFVERASNYLGLGKGMFDNGKKKISWKPFEELFGEKNLSRTRNDYKKISDKPNGYGNVDLLFR